MTDKTNRLVESWLSLTRLQMTVAGKLEQELQARHQLSLNEFYMLLFLSEAPGKRLRLQQLEAMVGLSQSAMSRLVSRFEAKGCGALQRHACDEDRRSIYTALTAYGQEKVDGAYGTVREVLRESLPVGAVESLLRHFRPEQPGGG